MDILKKIMCFLKIDLCDTFFLAGLIMLGIGLSLWKGAWLSFTVCGPLLMLIGYLIGGKQ